MLWSCWLQPTLSTHTISSSRKLLMLNMAGSPKKNHSLSMFLPTMLVSSIGHCPASSMMSSKASCPISYIFWAYVSLRLPSFLWPSSWQPVFGWSREHSNYIFRRVSFTNWNTVHQFTISWLRFLLARQSFGLSDAKSNLATNFVLSCITAKKHTLPLPKWTDSSKSFCSSSSTWWYCSESPSPSSSIRSLVINQPIWHSLCSHLSTWQANCHSIWGRHWLPNSIC